jgi:Abortive infection C-terminus
VDLEKKQEQRRRFLRGLYEATNGERFKFVRASDVATSLRLTPDDTNNVTDYLVGQGLMKWETLDGNVSITPEGVREAERVMAAEKQQSSGPRIPPQVIGEVAAAFDPAYTHNELTTLFLRAGVEDEYVSGTKLTRVRTWLQRIDADPEIDAQAVLGRLLEDFMDRPQNRVRPDDLDRLRERIREALAGSGFSYHPGGKIIGGEGLRTPSRSLADLIRGRDLPAISKEFDRAYADVLTDPAGAVTAACAILEATCHTYIADENLTPPTDLSLHPLWRVVQRHLGLAPAPELEEDLKRILGGLASIVDGVGAFRTHAGDAHGHGPEARPVEARHARLAVHAAHTVVTFVLETWAGRR